MPQPEYATDVMRKTLREKRRRYSHTLCPSCRKETLERRKLAWYLRPLRRVPGLSPRFYVCDNCHRKIILWRGNQHHR